MPRHRRFEGQHGGLLVAGFPDHDDVRILPEEGPQRPREGEPARRAPLHLRDSGEAVLDRVLDGEDVRVGPRRAALAQHRVERRGLSRPGRTAHDDPAIRPVEPPAHGRERLLLVEDLLHLGVAPASRTRMAIFSPRFAGRVETRRSTSRFPAEKPIRPSCGRRRSVMSRPASTLIRAVIVLLVAAGGMGSFQSWSTPLTRKRMRGPLEAGSMWMSLASRSSAATRILLTNRITWSPMARAGGFCSRSVSAAVSKVSDSGFTE